MEIMMTNLPSSICIWDITKILLTGLLNFVYYIWQMGKKKKNQKTQPKTEKSYYSTTSFTC